MPIRRFCPIAGGLCDSLAGTRACAAFCGAPPPVFSGASLIVVLAGVFSYHRNRDERARESGVLVCGWSTAPSGTNVPRSPMGGEVRGSVRGTLLRLGGCVRRRGAGRNGDVCLNGCRADIYRARRRDVAACRRGRWARRPGRSDRVWRALCGRVWRDRRGRHPCGRAPGALCRGGG
jgi:hypothetical protein